MLLGQISLPDKLLLLLITARSTTTTTFLLLAIAQFDSSPGVYVYHVLLVALRHHFDILGYGEGVVELACGFGVAVFDVLRGGLDVSGCGGERGERRETGGGDEMGEKETYLALCYLLGRGPLLMAFWGSFVVVYCRLLPSRHITRIKSVSLLRQHDV